MKLYEKIILLVFIFTIGLQIIDFPGKRLILILASLLLFITYFIGSYWLFENEDEDEGDDYNKTVLLIIFGIALSLSIIILPYLIWLNSEFYIYILQIPNTILFLYLFRHLFLLRKSESKIRNIKNIFIRSFVILAVTSFFTYTPISSNFYRDIIFSLNNGNDYIQANMKMFDYTEEFEDALKNRECEDAIKFALQANEAGKEWLGISLGEQIDALRSRDTILINKFSDYTRLWKISMTYSNLYKAYKCKAEDYYEKLLYEKALIYFIKSDNALNNQLRKPNYWKLEHASCKNSLALCYQKLQNYECADSLFIESIMQYKAVKVTLDKNIVAYYSNLSNSLAEQSKLGLSNKLYKTAFEILKKNSLE